MAGQGKAWRGKAVRVWPGLVRLGSARQGSCGEARQGKAGRGGARQGSCGLARRGRAGPGPARLGSARQLKHGHWSMDHATFTFPKRTQELEKDMFIGSTYKLVEAHKNETMLGFSSIKIMDRVLSRTETRDRVSHDENRRKVTVTAYFYTLVCLVNKRDSAEISEEALMSEFISGYYDLSVEAAT